MLKADSSRGERPPRVFRHAPSWSIAAALLSFAAVANALGIAVAGGPKTWIAVALIAAGVLSAAGIAYAALLLPRRAAAGRWASAGVAGVGVILNVATLSCAVAVALVVRW